MLRARCNLTHFKPFKPLDELIDSFEKGGIVWVCSPCYHGHGLEEADNYDNGSERRFHHFPVNPINRGT